MIHRLHAMRDTLEFDLAVLAVGCPAAITALIVFTTNRGVI